MNTSPDLVNTVDHVESLLTKTFGRPTPPKDEILRHKWLESEKAGRDLGLHAALQDWGARHYARWKTAHTTERRTRFLVFRLLLPLFGIWMISLLLEKLFGFYLVDTIIGFFT